MAATSSVKRWSDKLAKARRDKGAAYSEGMRSYVRTVVTPNGPKRHRVNGITGYIADVASACRPDKTHRTQAASMEDGTYDPVDLMQFRMPAQGVPCHTKCYKSGTGRGHGSLIHNEITYWLSFMKGTRKRQKVWDPCTLALLQALAEDNAEIVFNEYVMTSSANYGTAADLIVSIDGLPALVEIKSTRGPVHGNFSPYAEGMAHTGVLEGMPVNEYTMAQIQLLVMVLMLEEVGIKIVGNAGTWAQKSRRAIIYRVGKPARQTENTHARDVLKFTLDERVWLRRGDIMTVFRTHANMTKKKSKRAAKRTRRVAELTRAYVSNQTEDESKKIAAANRRKRQRALVDKGRARIGRYKERDDKKGFDLRRQAARLGAALRAARAKRYE